MNRRERAPQIFISPIRDESNKRQKAIHQSKAWKDTVGDDGVFDLPFSAEYDDGDDDNDNNNSSNHNPHKDTFQNRRKRRLRLAKEQAISESLEAQRQRQQQQEQAMKRNKTTQRILEQRRIFDQQLKDNLATKQEERRIRNIQQQQQQKQQQQAEHEKKMKEAADNNKPKRRKKRMKKIIRRKIIKTVPRKQPPPPEEDEEEALQKTPVPPPVEEEELQKPPPPPVPPPVEEDESQKPPPPPLPPPVEEEELQKPPPPPSPPPVEEEELQKPPPPPSPPPPLLKEEDAEKDEPLEVEVEVQVEHDDNESEQHNEEEVLLSHIERDDMKEETFHYDGDSEDEVLIFHDDDDDDVVEEIYHDDDDDTDIEENVLDEDHDDDDEEDFDMVDESYHEDDDAVDEDGDLYEEVDDDEEADVVDETYHDDDDDDIDVEEETFTEVYDDEEVDVVDETYHDDDDDDIDVEEETFEEVYEDEEVDVVDEAYHDDDIDVEEETVHEDDDISAEEKIIDEEVVDYVVEGTAQEDKGGDEEKFFATVRAENNKNEEVSVGESERFRREEEAFEREQEELFRLAAERQAQEEEDLLWEEEEMRLEQEARRLADDKEVKDLSPEEQRTETLQDMIRSRPSLKPSSSKREKLPDEENVLDREIGYRAPSLLALVNQGKLELRPPPPEEHKEQYKPVVEDAASIARLVRLNEHVVESEGKRDNVTSTDSSYEAWGKHHSMRGQNRKPVQSGNRSNGQIMVNEAATLGKLRGKRQVDPSELGRSTHGDDIDIDELGDDKHDGAKVFRTEHLIDRHVRRNRETDFTPDYDDEEFHTLDDVVLPTPDQPCFTPRKTSKTQQEIREELSRTVAEGYWSRYYRLERPGAKLNVKPGCACKYCGTANAWQTYAYQKKWADERLPPKETLSETEDPSQFGYIARLYLPDETPDDIDFVDLKEPDEPTPKREYDLGSVDGSCSVDFSLGSLDLIDESDESDFSYGNEEESSTRSPPERNAMTPVATAAADYTAAVADTDTKNHDMPSKISSSPDIEASVPSEQVLHSNVPHDAIGQNSSGDEVSPVPMHGRDKVPLNTAPSSNSFPKSAPNATDEVPIHSSTKSQTERPKKFKPFKWVKKALFGGPENEASQKSATSETAEASSSEKVTAMVIGDTISQDEQQQPVQNSFREESHPRSTAADSSAAASNQSSGEIQLIEEVIRENEPDSDVETVAISNTVLGERHIAPIHNYQFQGTVLDDRDVAKAEYDLEVAEDYHLELSCGQHAAVYANMDTTAQGESAEPSNQSTNEPLTREDGGPKPARRKMGILAQLEAKRQAIERAKAVKLVSEVEALEGNEKPEDSSSKPVSASVHAPDDQSFTSDPSPAVEGDEQMNSTTDLNNVPVKQKLGLHAELRAKKEALEKANAAKNASELPAAKDKDDERQMRQLGGPGSAAASPEPEGTPPTGVNPPAAEEGAHNVPIKQKLGLLGELRAKKEALERAKTDKRSLELPARNDENEEPFEDSGSDPASSSATEADEAQSIDPSPATEQKSGDVPVKRKLGLLGELRAKKETLERIKEAKIDEGLGETSNDENGKQSANSFGSTPVAPTSTPTPTTDPVPTGKEKKQNSADLKGVPVKKRLGLLSELKAKKLAHERAKASQGNLGPASPQDETEKPPVGGASLGSTSLAPKLEPKAAVVPSGRSASVENEKTTNSNVQEQELLKAYKEPAQQEPKRTPLSSTPPTTGKPDSKAADVPTGRSASIENEKAMSSNVQELLKASEGVAEQEPRKSPLIALAPPTTVKPDSDTDATTGKIASAKKEKSTNSHFLELANAYKGAAEQERKKVPLVSTPPTAGKPDSNTGSTTEKTESAEKEKGNSKALEVKENTKEADDEPNMASLVATPIAGNTLKVAHPAKSPPTAASKSKVTSNPEVKNPLMNEAKKPAPIPIKKQLGMLGELKAKKEALERAKAAKANSKPVVKPPKEKVIKQVDGLNAGSEHQRAPPWGELKFGEFKKNQPDPAPIISQGITAPSPKNVKVEQETHEVEQAGKVAAFFLGGR